MVVRAVALNIICLMVYLAFILAPFQHFLANKDFQSETLEAFDHWICMKSIDPSCVFSPNNVDK